MFARNLVLSCWLLSAVVSCGSKEQTTSEDHGTPRGPGFLRGLNLGNRLDAPTEGDWGPVLRESGFPAVAARGFDHVRLPVRFNAYAEAATKRVIMNATRFTARTGLSVYNGEWGVGDRADPESRVRWIRDVRKESERLGVGWAYWDDGGAFQLFDAETGKWNEPLVGALFD